MTYAGNAATNPSGSNTLFFGDNLDVLRERIKDESFDLIYLDPPFNSRANYNVLFGAPTGRASEAQVEAFRDTWEWGDRSESAYDDVIKQNGNLALMLSGMRKCFGENNMMAYLAMMAVRLIELHRVLKPTGSIYLHCDPTASHYLKLLLDGLFGVTNYRNEIIWERSKNPKGSQFKSLRWGPSTDTVLFFAKSERAQLNVDAAKPLTSAEGLAARYPNADEKGRWADGPILCSDSMGPRPNLVYEYKGFTPGPAGWRMERGELERLDEGGDLYWTSNNRPRRKIRPDPTELNPLSNCWTDIPPLNSQARERLGYPTQKPLVLLERIIKASSAEDSLILDPFCGCGTTIEASERLGRHWTGIDVTHYAITLIERRLRRWLPDADYKVVGRPTDLEGARELARRDKHQFQWWASWLLGAQYYREEKRSADRGIDGNIFFPNGPYGTGRIIISVKGGDNVGVAMVRDLRGVIEREEAEMGILVTLSEPTRAMITEASAGFVKHSAHGRLPRIQIATIGDILDGRRPTMPRVPDLDQRPVRSIHKRKASAQLELLLPFEGKRIAPQKGDFVDPRYLNLDDVAVAAE